MSIIRFVHLYLGLVTNDIVY